MIYLESKALAEVMTRTLLALGVSPESAGCVTTSLVQTSLRGVDSHGINLFPHYCRAVLGGRINRNPEFAIEQSASATAIVNADHGFGHHAGTVAVEHAKKMATEHGVGAVVVRDSSHFGAAAYFALQAAEAGFLGFAFTNADALVKVFNAKSAFFGTNPICFTAPLAREEPFCLDMATSRVSWNKIKEHRLTGTPVPPGWAYDENGLPTEDANSARMLEPSGGYKGYGLGMMVEVLCGVLAGGPAGTELMAMYNTPLDARRRISHFFVALDVSRFLPLVAFSERLQDMVDELRALEAESGQVMVAGDPEKRTAVVRRAKGIPINPTTFGEFVAIEKAFEGVVVR